MDLKTLDNSNNVSKSVDSEKSAFEKFEAEFKSTVFGVIFVLLKEEEGNIWFAGVLIMIEFVEILTFVINEEVALLSFPAMLTNGFTSSLRIFGELIM